MNIGMIIAGLIVAYVVYVCFNKGGFFLGFMVNCVYVFVSYFLQETNQELTMVIIAGIILGALVESVIEYIAYQKAGSFIGYLVYILLIVLGIGLIIFLGWGLFNFIGNPSFLLKT